MRPQDLDDHAPIEPDDGLLASVHARGRSFRRRRTAQRSTSGTAGLVIVALVVGIALTRGETSNRRITLPAASSTTVATALTQNAITGKWRPTSITGYNRPLTKPPLGWEPRLSFNGRGSWTGSDGCNDIGGTYRVDASGMHFNHDFISTLVNCGPDIPDFGPIESAARIDLIDDQLVFSDADGSEIARFERAGVTARIELSSTTMTAGSTMSGHVIVENDTGHEIHATGCGGLFGLTLANDKIHQEPIWPSCARDYTIPVGESRYPVIVLASYDSCNQTGTDGLQRCIPPGTPPPLPPGDYQVTLAQESPIVPVPPPIDLTIEPPA